jgi:hypothetical protein
MSPQAQKLSILPSSRSITQAAGVLMLLSLNLRAAKGSSDFTAASLSYAQEMTPNPADAL